MSSDRELRKGSAETLILALLEERDRHGYEIAKLIDHRSAGTLTLHVASLYPTLYRLERRGLRIAGLKLLQVDRALAERQHLRERSGGRRVPGERTTGECRD